MGEVFKIIIVALLAICARLFCIDELIIGSILLLSIPLYFINKKFIEINPLLICSIFFMIAIDSGYYFSIFIWGFFIIIYRGVFNLKLLGCNLWVFLLIVLLGTYLINDNLIQIPAMLFLLFFPFKFNFKINLKYSSLNLHYVFFLILILVSLHIFISDNQDKVAYYEKGVWAKSNKEYSLNNLSNEISYSYSEFVNFIRAEKINKTDHIGKYKTIWLVTPTEPFTKKELENLNAWLIKGGKLIVVCDHTDLYGHARCVNQIVKIYNMKTNYSCLFNTENKEIFRTSNFDYANIKTGVPVFGSFSWPLLTTFMWEENAYYANDNFFGPLAPSGDDIYKRHALVVKKMVGLGEITLLGDSTFFSNFALYQPWNSEFISKISKRSWFAIISLIFPFLLIIILYSRSLELNSSILILLLSVSYFISLSTKKFNNDDILDYGKSPQLWSGNYKFIMENECPFSSISTAYSISPLSGRKPKWINDYKEIIDSLDVIWVDTLPPPNSNWRWIKIEDNHSYFKISKNNPFYSLYKNLNCENFMPLITNRTSINLLNVRGVFNDAIMNDWWYNSGISPNRLLRFKEWINWLNESKINELPKFEINNFHKEYYTAYLKIDKKPEIIKLQILKPISDTGFVNLGNGLSAFITKRNGIKTLLSLSQYNEKWGSPKIWTLTYQE